MAGRDDEIDLAIAALQAVKVVQRAYASSKDGCDRVEDIANMLAMGDQPMGQFGGIQTCVADAISRAFLNRSRS